MADKTWKPLLAEDVRLQPPTSGRLNARLSLSAVYLGWRLRVHLSVSAPAPIKDLSQSLWQLFRPNARRLSAPVPGQPQRRGESSNAARAAPRPGLAAVNHGPCAFIFLILYTFLSLMGFWLS